MPVLLPRLTGWLREWGGQTALKPAPNRSTSTLIKLAQTSSKLAAKSTHPHQTYPPREHTVTHVVQHMWYSNRECSVGQGKREWAPEGVQMQGLLATVLRRREGRKGGSGSDSG